MKNLIITIIVFTSLQLNAQYILPVETFAIYNRTSTTATSNHYFKDVNNQLDKFIGVWKYQTTSDLVEFTITKNENSSDGNVRNSYVDELHIDYKFTQNGIVIYDTLTIQTDSSMDGGYFSFPDNVNKYRIVSFEPDQIIFPNVCQMWSDMEYLPNTSGQPHLNWVTHYIETSDNSIAPQMPLNMVFEKQ